MKTTLLQNEKNINNFHETADIETSSDEYAKRFSGKIGEYFLKVQTELTLELLKSVKGKSVLDVGGGHAQLAVPLVKKGYDVTVIGSSDSCRMLLDRYLASNSFNYQTCNILKLPFQDKDFDIVIAFRLLPHVNKWQELIKEMCRVAYRGIIVDYPDIRSFNIFYRLLFKTKKIFEGNTRTYRSFSRKEVVNEFHKYGFNSPVYKPEFFLPMVIHRFIKSYFLSNSLETVSRKIGLTYLFGSPIIVRLTP